MSAPSCKSRYRRALALTLSVFVGAAVAITTGLVTSAPAQADPPQCSEKYVFLDDRDVPVYNYGRDSISLCPDRIYLLGKEKPNLQNRVGGWRNYSDKTVCLWDRPDSGVNKNLWLEIDRLGPNQSHDYPVGDPMPAGAKNRADAVGPC